MRNWDLCLIMAAAAVLSGCSSFTKVAVTTPPQQPAQLVITTASLPAATAGTAYSSGITVSGGTSPFAYTATNLPAGVAINSSTGIITGTPAQSAVGTSSVGFKVVDSSQPSAQTATANLSLTVNQAAPSKLTITTASLPNGIVGIAYSSAITASGGTPPYTYSATNLQSDLAINGSSGAITGTPQQSDVGTTSVIFKVIDSGQPAQSATSDLDITVNPAVVASACSKMSTGDSASLNGFVPFPATNAWNTDISSAPLDPNNSAITSASGFAGLHLHHDFSSTAGGNYGIPYVVVDSSTTPLVPINVIDYASESDVAQWRRSPSPRRSRARPPIAMVGPTPTSATRTCWCSTATRCMLYETFNTHRCNGAVERPRRKRSGI